MTVRQYIELIYNECEYDVRTVCNEHILTITKTALCMSYSNVNNEFKNSFNAMQIIDILDVESVVIKDAEHVKLYIDVEKLYRDE